MTAIVQNDCPFKEEDGTVHDGTLFHFTCRLRRDHGQPERPRFFHGGSMAFPDPGKNGVTTDAGQARLDIALKRMRQRLAVVPRMFPRWVWCHGDRGISRH